MIRPAPLLVSLGAAWTALVIAAPLLGWPALYAAAHLVCHQLPDRTFHVSAGPLAVCARCLGLYLGAAGGGASARLSRSKPFRPATRTARATVAVAALPTLLTLVAEWLLRWPVTNAIRFAAAVPLGAAAAWVVVRALEVDWRA